MEIIGFGLLLLLGLIFGQINEANHYKDLARREHELAHIKTTNRRHVTDGYTGSAFVAGNVVISIDYFKRIAALFRALVGGRINSYTTLVERARREAVLRMKEQARDAGCDFIANVRLETASVFQNAQTGRGSLEVYAYGTALK